jgi:osmotically-inducible protein OsmY
MKYPVLFLLVALSPVLSGCAGALLGAGATVGVKAAQEGGLEAAINDTVIATQINDYWFKYDLETFAKLHLTVDQGRVLITGVVQKPEARVEAVRLAWQAKGVKEVINEIRVANSDGITGYARDTWIAARLRTTLTFDRYVQSINYSIDTVQGIVYLMGVARDQAELNRVIGIARTIPDVKQVVSYVKLAGEPITGNKPVSDSGLMAPMGDEFNQNGGMTPPPPGNYQPETYQSQGDGMPTPLVPEPVQQEPIGNGGY